MIKSKKSYKQTIFRDYLDHKLLNIHKEVIQLLHLMDLNQKKEKL